MTPLRSVRVIERIARGVGSTGLPTGRLLPAPLRFRRRRFPAFISAGPIIHMEHFGPAVAGGEQPPQRHPLAGVAAFTVLRRGLMLYRDGAGHEEVIGPGDVLCTVAGAGTLEVAEPVFSTGREEDEVCEGFRLWVPLPEAAAVDTKAEVLEGPPVDLRMRLLQTVETHELFDRARMDLMVGSSPDLADAGYPKAAPFGGGDGGAPFFVVEGALPETSSLRMPLPPRSEVAFYACDDDVTLSLSKKHALGELPARALVMQDGESIQVQLGPGEVVIVSNPSDEADEVLARHDYHNDDDVRLLVFGGRYAPQHEGVRFCASIAGDGEAAVAEAMADWRGPRLRFPNPKVSQSQL